MTKTYLVLTAAAWLAASVPLMSATAPAARNQPAMPHDTGEAAGQDEQSTAPDAGAPAALDGAAVFGQRCKGCHAAEAGQPSYGGPNLAGVVGRPAAATPFRYSPALRNSGLTWTREELDAFLASPMAKVPGSNMVVSLADAGQRRAVIEFLGATASEQGPQP